MYCIERISDLNIECSKLEHTDIYCPVNIFQLQSLNPGKIIFKFADNLFSANLFSTLDISPLSIASLKNLIELSNVFPSIGKGTPSLPQCAKLNCTGSLQEVLEP
jgi:hypothetical protein